MVIQWLVNQFTAFTTYMINGLPAPSVPSWIATMNSDISSVVTFINQLGAWIPSQLLVTVITAYVAVLAISITIKVLRIIASYFTGGGGSVA